MSSDPTVNPYAPPAEVEPAGTDDDDRPRRRKQPSQASPDEESD